MPHPFPEQNVALSSDSEIRSLFKLASILYSTVGSVGGPWPEQTLPLVSDNEERLTQKINKMLEA